MSDEPQEWEIAGVQLKCQHCGYGAFHTRVAQLHTPGLTFFDLEWLNRSAHCFVCDRCGHMHWFLPKE
jgi:hypothetical protein